jgi:hypothetical protein
MASLDRPCWYSRQIQFRQWLWYSAPKFWPMTLAGLTTLTLKAGAPGRCCAFHCHTACSARTRVELSTTSSSHWPRAVSARIVSLAFHESSLTRRSSCVTIGAAARIELVYTKARTVGSCSAASSMQRTLSTAMVQISVSGWLKCAGSVAVCTTAVTPLTASW